MSSNVTGRTAYRVELSYSALHVYLEISSVRDVREVEDHIELLATFPYVGLVYDPLYEAARPSFKLRVLYAGHFGIYYDVDEDAKQVNIDFIEDQRRLPASRFRD